MENLLFVFLKAWAIIWSIKLFLYIKLCIKFKIRPVISFDLKDCFKMCLYAASIYCLINN